MHSWLASSTRASGSWKRSAGCCSLLTPPSPKASLLKWLAADRAMIEFNRQHGVDARAPAFRAIVRQWITHV